MKIGYVRVSTQEQNTLRQEILMRELGADESCIDPASDKTADRPELKKLMEFASKKEAIGATTPTGKFMPTVFGAVAELEREYRLIG